MKVLFIYQITPHFHVLPTPRQRQWRVEGWGRTGRPPRASKAGEHPKSDTTKCKCCN